MFEKQPEPLQEAYRELAELSQTELEALLWQGVEKGTIVAKRMDDGEWGFSLSSFGLALASAQEIKEFRE